MTPAAYGRLKVLFHEALEMEAGSREAFFCRLAATDPKITTELRSLLAEHERADGFLERPDGFIADDNGGAGPGQIGNYRIDRELGVGGSGRVYLATRIDDEFNRPVAIKVLERHPADRGFRRRLSLERRALAQLDHPNIAHLLDWGESEDGRPFLVMEFVDGQPIDEYCRSRSCSAAECLNLFLQVCAAVRHAHGKLIVHRDLKPANIMVKPGGTVKLLDFGIARLLDSEDATVTSLRLTPAYASPEQLRGEAIAIASDIYSLGVVLYELLTGVLPYRLLSHNPVEVSRAVLEQEPARPEGIATDLGLIVLKALRKEPASRYESAGELAEDIERYADARPVLARGGSRRYVVGRFIRRNRLPVAVGVVGVTLLAVAAGVATWNLWLAERRYQALRGFAHSVLSGMNEAGSLGQTEEERQIASAAVTYLDDAGRQRANDDELQMDIAGAYDRLGDTQGLTFNPNRGKSADARVNYRKAHAIFERLWLAHPDERHGLALLENIAQIGVLFEDPDRGFRFVSQGIPVSDRLLTMNERGLEVLGQSAILYQVRAKALFSMGELALAQESFHRAETLSGRLAALYPGNAWALMLWSVDIDHLSRVLQSQGDTEGALRGSLRGLDEARRAVALSPTVRNRREAAVIERYITGELRDLKRFDEAISIARDAVAALQEIAHDDLSNENAKEDLAAIHVELGSVLFETGKREEGLGHHRLALQLRAEVASRDPYNINGQRCYAISLIRMGKDLLATDSGDNPWFDQAIEVCRRIQPAAPSDVFVAANLARACHGAAEVAFRKSSREEARRWIEQSVNIWHDVTTRDPLDVNLRTEAAEADRLLASAEFH